MTDATRIEEQLAHLTRSVEDLSDVVARQDAEIERLARRVEMLMAREAERETERSDGMAAVDRVPPHW